ncbi:hypothetical protein TNCV_2831971 [Trichonephila clavipes]|nr:hypothetical protein TNCV_2831971 [Trichonephila clavipes]
MQAIDENRRFREGRESVENIKYSGRPQPSRTAENIEKVSVVVSKTRLQTIAESVRISLATCQWILPKNLNKHKVCQHIVPRMLNKGQSADEVKSTSQAELKDMDGNGFRKYFDGIYIYNPRQKCAVAQGSYFEKGYVSAV